MKVVLNSMLARDSHCGPGRMSCMTTKKFSPNIGIWIIITAFSFPLCPTNCKLNMLQVVMNFFLLYHISIYNSPPPAASKSLAFLSNLSISTTRSTYADIEKTLIKHDKTNKHDDVYVHFLYLAWFMRKTCDVWRITAAFSCIV